MPIRCDIVSQDRVVFSGDVDRVTLPGAAGEMGILPHHVPLITSLKFGVITIHVGAQEQMFTVAGGVAEVQPDQVTVLADAAENVLEINEQRAEEARDRAEKRLVEVDKNANDYLEIQAALKRSNLRTDAVRKYREKRR